MKIQFKPTFPMATVNHILTGTQWTPDEIKDIDDDATFRATVDNQPVYIKVTDDLLSSPNFVNADTGKNPNFVCSGCGGPALDDGFADAFDRTKMLETTDGHRLCFACFKASAPVPVPFAPPSPPQPPQDPPAEPTVPVAPSNPPNAPAPAAASPTTASV